MKFSFDDPSEQARVRSWQGTHNDANHAGEGQDGGDDNTPYTGAAGGQFEFRFFPTGLGQIQTVVCCICERLGKPREVHTLDLTDYSSW